MSTIDLSSALDDASAGTFITGAEKAVLAETQEPLYVIGTDPKTETQFGDQTHFYVKAKCWGRDEQRILAFSHNAFRERQATNVGKLIAESGQIGGPVFLGRFKTQNGKDAWQLGVKPFDGEEAKAVTTPVTPAATPKPDFDSDVPF